MLYCLCTAAHHTKVSWADDSTLQSRSVSSVSGLDTVSEGLLYKSETLQRTLRAVGYEDGMGLTVVRVIDYNYPEGCHIAGIKTAVRRTR